MTTEITFPEKDKAAPEVAAPSAHAALPNPAVDVSPAVTLHKPIQQAIQLEPVKRKKTWGERLFDLTTYGGFALIGNEIAATAIVRQAKEPNFIGKAYRAGDKFFKGIGVQGELPYLQQRVNYISFAIIGGFLMVPFIKKLEDYKGSCVRFADKFIYGKRAQTDPEIVSRHEQMDKAPIQTWGSLGSGRTLTVAAAYTVDATVNWKDGLSARLLKKTSYANYASFEHLSDHIAEWAGKKLTTLRNLTPSAAATQKAWLKDLVGLSTLSATLTALFYVSSKIFAKKRDEKIILRTGHSANDLRDDAGAEPELQPSPISPSESPAAKVTAISHQSTLNAPASQVAASH